MGAGDGPSKCALMDEADRLCLRVVFLGNVPHHELPRLYRAADCFVTMSLSETFGLTCLEAQMCGCPAVMPDCEVFDEIWSHRVPQEWRYTIDQKDGKDLVNMQELARAISAAQRGREYLAKHPVQQTWKDASEELLGQYEECIKFMASARGALREFVHFMDHCIRVAICAAFFGLILSRYYA